MNTRRPLNALLLCCAFGSLLAASPAPAEDNIERSCTARYGLYIPQVASADGRQLGMKLEAYANIDHEFSARRGCGRTVPNRCRQRASEALLNCMVAHAGARASTPAACTSNGVQNYRITNLEAEVQKVACARVREVLGAKMSNMPDPVYATISLRAFIKGDDGCGGGDEKYLSKYIGTSFRVACSRGQ